MIRPMFLGMSTYQRPDPRTRDYDYATLPKIRRCQYGTSRFRLTRLYCVGLAICFWEALCSERPLSFGSAAISELDPIFLCRWRHGIPLINLPMRNKDKHFPQENLYPSQPEAFCLLPVHLDPFFPG